MVKFEAEIVKFYEKNSQISTKISQISSYFRLENEQCIALSKNLL